MATLYDCIILGGGPAGLAAGVYMGRYLRPTLILDHKIPQTRWHRPIAHNVLGFPAGIHRNQLLDWGRAHVATYECVEIRRATVRGIEQRGDLFVLRDEEGGTHQCRGLILAMGVEYLLPDIPGILAYAGKSIWHCPECDGYKCRGKRVAVIGTGVGSAEMALGVSIWSDEIVLCANGQDAELPREAEAKLRAAGVAIVRQKIRGLAGNPEEGTLEAIEFEDGSRRAVYGAFANEGCGTPDELLSQLPLELHKGRWVKVDHRMRTSIPCCYAAGDLIAFAQTQLSVAMGTGATAAIWLHKELLPEGLRLSE